MPGWRRRVSRAMVALGLSLALVFLLAPVAGVLLIQRYDGAVAREDLLAPDARANAAAARVTGPLNYLIIGSDRRTRNPGMGERSDTIIIAHVTRSLDRVYLISIPRDLYVRIPPDATLGFAGDQARINAAFDYGRAAAAGTRLLSQTLTALVGIRFDGAAVVRFDGLKRAVEVLGGVELCVDVRTVSVHTRKVFEVGCRVMDSTDVLDYLRQRDFSDGDFTRQRHQQQFLKAFLEQARSAGVLANPIRLDELLRAVAGALTVDTGEVALPDLVVALREVGAEDLVGIRIPHGYDMINGQSVVLPTEEAKGLFAAIRGDALERWTATHAKWVNGI